MSDAVYRRRLLPKARQIEIPGDRSAEITHVSATRCIPSVEISPDRTIGVRHAFRNVCSSAFQLLVRLSTSVPCSCTTSGKFQAGSRKLPRVVALEQPRVVAAALV